MKSAHRILALGAAWTLGVVLTAAQASPVLRTSAFTAARALAAPSQAPNTSPLISPFPGASSPEAIGGFWNTLAGTPSPSACPTGVCIALPPAMPASMALMNFQEQNQCTIKTTPVSQATACQPVAGMSVSANYLDAMLPAFEGDVPQYYNDSKCNCTAGVGHLVQLGQCPASLAAPGKQKTPQATNACVKNTYWKSPNAFPGASVSNAQIQAWEQSDIAWAVSKAKQVLSGKQVTQTEFDAAVDLIYNGGLSKYYNIKSNIESGNFIGAAQENTRRGINNGVPENRIAFENGGLAQGTLCK